MRYHQLLFACLLVGLPSRAIAQANIMMSTGSSILKFEMLHPTWR